MKLLLLMICLNQLSGQKFINSTLIYIPFVHNITNLGGSCFQQVNNTLGTTNNPSDLDDPEYFIKCFNTIQYLVQNENISSCHDISDGGLITTLLEMAFTGNIGIRSEFSIFNIQTPVEFWMSETLGVVVEINGNYIVVVVVLL